MILAEIPAASIWLSAAIGAVVVAIGGAVDRRFARDTEREQWQRNDKRKVYADFLAAADELRFTHVTVTNLENRYEGIDGTFDPDDDTEGGTPEELLERLKAAGLAHTAAHRSYYRCSEEVMLCAPASVVALMTPFRTALLSYNNHDDGNTGRIISEAMRLDLGYPPL